MAESGSCKTVIEAVVGRYNPQGAPGWNAALQFNIAGTGGGTYNVTIQDGVCAFAEGSVPKATATVTTNDDTWLGIVNGTVNAQMAYFTGKIKVNGNIGDVLKLNNPNIFRKA